MNNVTLNSDLVDVRWLKEHLLADNLIVLDASIVPIGSKVVTGERRYVPQSQIFDFEHKIRDIESDLPHMLPSAALFAAEVCKIGVSKDSVIVIYDDKGIYSSPRAWWMFKAMGHQRVAVLDGGLPAWISAGQPTANSTVTKSLVGNFTATLNDNLVVDADAVQLALQNKAYAVIDARSAGRFQGSEAEPRKGLRGGHMPGAFNIPYPEVLTKGFYKNANELKILFHDPIKSRQELIFTCGSGVTASILFLAATLAGYEKNALYDGSWCEWGIPSSRTVITGTNAQGGAHAKKD